MNYHFSRFQDKHNPDHQGYILSRNNTELLYFMILIKSLMQN